ncbi:MAG: acetate--CoA ligase family protein [Infirmifilum sp.]
MAHPVIDKAIEEKRAFLTLRESFELLESYELPVVNYVYITSKEELPKVHSLSFPVVLKLDSPDIVHKTEFGAVKTGISSALELEKAIDEMTAKVHEKIPGVRINGFLIQEMVRQAHEVIVGGLNDSQFGPVIAFGIGGILVEALKDVVFDIAPVSREQALDLIRRIKGYRILEGYRGLPKANIELLADVISRASQMFAQLSSSVSEMDLNPIFVSSDWIKIADARFKLNI